MTTNTGFWPDGAQLAVTISMQVEAGGQPHSGTPGPVTEPIEPGYPDLVQNSFYDYGVREGIPRLLELFDKHDVKVTSFMIGEAVDRHPELAREIVRRGHEAAAHGRHWANQHLLAPEDERAWIEDSVRSIDRATGTTPVGYNCYWMRGSVHTLELLQQLGFVYHIDDLSGDEPFLQHIVGKPFVTVPYTVHINDISSFGFSGFSPDAYEQQLCDEFEQLYEEGRGRRRMMSIFLHDRISGHASRVRVLDRFLSWARQRPNVWWAPRDQIARWALATPEITPTVERAPAEVSGLPGESATPMVAHPKRGSSGLATPHSFEPPSSSGERVQADEGRSSWPLRGRKETWP
jgi:peptidoglycan/xylan/chitin deacetylase (PgdA/CDA1 family)